MPLPLPLPTPPRSPRRGPLLPSHVEDTTLSPRAGSLQQLIRDGATAGLRRRHLYRLAIESQLEAQYTHRLDAAERRLAARRLLTDPRVRQLFDRLYRAA